MEPLLVKVVTKLSLSQLVKNKISRTEDTGNCSHFLSIKVNGDQGSHSTYNILLK